ncbi:MAG: isoprenylcysteine carboxylmethyltransferase family protein [Polaromonas sp.]|nr:isoprenylcysteine carboxylmethyltransferase family protein [Polaromonas sp.]
MGILLVGLQFGLLFVLAALAASNVMHGVIPAGAFLLAGTSVALAAWTLLHNRPGNFNIHPSPKVHGVLVTTGPYQWIRHPMYTSVLLGAGALAWTSSPFVGWATWSALAIVLLMKSTLEERCMREKHPGYAAYTQRTKRFLPWLF